MQTKNM